MDLARKVPLFSPWAAVALAMVVFSTARWLLPLAPAPDAFHALDLAFADSVADGRGHTVGDGQVQPLGARALVRWTTGGLASVTGSPERAGLLLAFLATMVCIPGVVNLSRQIFPSRGYAFLCGTVFAATGSLSAALSPAPTVAVLMALLVWAVVLFYQGLERRNDVRIYLAAALVGLATWIRFEFLIFWGLLMLYGFGVGARKREGGTWFWGAVLAGTLLVALVLWPFVHRNMALPTDVPLLPGVGATHILGADVQALQIDGAPSALPEKEAFLRVWSLHSTSSAGMGIFLSLLWPVGLALALYERRKRPLGAFWLCLLPPWFLLLSFASLVTGPASLDDCLLASAALLVPFAVLVPVYALRSAFARRPDDNAKPWAYAVTGLLLVVFSLGPARAVLKRDAAIRTEQQTAYEALLRTLADESLSGLCVASDAPGLLLSQGLPRVVGLNGETDAGFLGARFADGSWNPEKLVEQLERGDVGLVHLTGHYDRFPTVLPGGLSLEPLPQIEPPHVVYRLVWPSRP